MTPNEIVEILLVVLTRNNSWGEWAGDAAYHPANSGVAAPVLSRGDL